MSELPSTTPRPEAEATDVVSDDTSDEEDVSFGWGELITKVTPDAMSSWGHKELLQELGDATPADLLAYAWSVAPVGDEHAYIQLIGGCIRYDEEEDGSITTLIANIKKHVPERALDRLPSLTTIDHENRVLVIGLHKDLYQDAGWKNLGTEVVLGPVAELLRRRGAGDVHPKVLADATSQLISSDDPSRIETQFSNAEPRHAGQAGQDRTTGPETAARRPGPRAIVSAKGVPLSVIESISVYGPADAEGQFTVPESVLAGRTPCGNERTPCGNPGRDWVNFVRLAFLPEETKEALLGRSPRGSFPQIAVPTELREAIIKWRPVLAESEPLAALLQLILFSFQRDEDYNFDADCTNIPFSYERVFEAFGLAERTAYSWGLNSGMLLELFRQMVDSEFAVTGWHSENEKSRVIKSHGIPDNIIKIAKELMHSPGDYDDWTCLIDGTSANRRNYNLMLRQERLEEIEENEPAIEPPSYVRDIQEYLNTLPQATFAHGGYGTFNGDAINEAIEKVSSSIETEMGRDEELRKLYWMRKFPQPLYMASDYSPRPKCDYYNQAMNLPSKVLRAMYTERDYELDLSKAHLGCYVPTVKRFGLDVPILEDKLQATMAGEIDLWAEIGDCFDTDLMPDPSARRKAAKRLYSSPYGSSRKNMLFEMLKEYRSEADDYPSSVDALRPVLSHPLVSELFETRDKLEAIITDQGGLKDASGRFIPLSVWDGEKAQEDRWRPLMAYVNASFEQKIMAAPFALGRQERERDARSRFTIWLYQYDGITVRMGSKASHSKQIDRLQSAVAEKADELGVPTKLEVDYMPSL